MGFWFGPTMAIEINYCHPLCWLKGLLLSLFLLWKNHPEGTLVSNLSFVQGLWPGTFTGW